MLGCVVMKKKFSLSFFLTFLFIFSLFINQFVLASADSSTPALGNDKKLDFFLLENYILPNSNKAFITEKDLYELTPYSIDLARNEIYARHGYIFKSEQYSSYFDSKPWYKKNAKFNENKLSSIEKKNALFLKSYSDKLKLNFKKVVGNKILVDINSDGKKDTIKLTCIPGSDAYTLTVNNSYVSGTGCNLDGVMFICDIDSKDKYKEIAISEAGPSSDNYTYLYFYDGKKLISMEGVEGDNYSIKMSGSGTFSTQSRGQLLQTWFFTDLYKLSSSHKLVNLPQKLYKMNTIVKLKTQLKLQKSPNDASTAVVLKVGEKVMITDTDNKKWCAIETEKGVKGWFSVDNLGEINGRIANEVLDGLCYED
jgi:hypothetical protein